MAHILVADDVAANRFLVMRLLQHYGYTVSEAINGAEAYDLTIQHLPDLILMDIAMPVLDGLATTRRLKQHPAVGHIPVIALSAHAQDSDAEQARQAGCAAYITKPTDMPALLSTVKQWLA